MTLKDFIKLKVGDKVIVFGTDLATVSQRFSNDVWVRWDALCAAYSWGHECTTRFNCYKGDALLFERVKSNKTEPEV